jgi:hypothetical protein
MPLFTITSAPTGFGLSGADAGLGAIANSEAAAGQLASVTTLGSALSGVGLGFGVGSLAGGFIQSALGKTGPAPTIGAGVGAAAGAAIGSIVPGIGTVIGGLLGGLIGGTRGGLIIGEAQ